jgi:hypothetical protein
MNGGSRTESNLVPLRDGVYSAAKGPPFLMTRPGEMVPLRGIEPRFRSYQDRVLPLNDGGLLAESRELESQAVIGSHCLANRLGVLAD